MKLRRMAAALVAASALAAPACGDSSSSTSSTAAASDALILGLLVPESGDLSAIVRSLTEPTKLAVDQINNAGGVNGKPVKLEQADDGSNPTVASTSFDNLVNGRNVNAIVGPAGSSTALGILDKIKSKSIPTCSGSTTAAALSTADSGGYFFRTAPSDNLQGPALADVVTSDNHTKVGLLVRNDDYGTGFGKAIEEGVKGSGGTVVASVAYDPQGANFDGEAETRP